MEIGEWGFCNSVLLVLFGTLKLLRIFVIDFQFDVSFIFIFSYNFLCEAVKNSTDLLY